MLDIRASGKVRKTRQGLEMSARLHPYPRPVILPRNHFKSFNLGVWRLGKHKAPSLLKVQNVRIAFHEQDAETL